MTLNMFKISEGPAGGFGPEVNSMIYYVNALLLRGIAMVMLTPVFTVCNCLDSL